MTETSDITIVEGEVMDLLDLEEGLSDWEVKFIESVAGQLVDRPMTDKQIAVVHRIWDAKCG